MGRFVSADSIVPDPVEPQQFNRYSYTLNNPLLYTDPTGHCVIIPPVDTFVCLGAALVGITLVANHWANSEPLPPLEHNPALTEEINLIGFPKKAGAGFGFGASYEGSLLYHAGSDTWALGLCECSGPMSPTAGISEGIAWGSTDQSTAADALAGFSITSGVSLGYIGISRSTAASPIPQTDSSLLWAEPPNEPLVFAPSGTSLSSISVGLSVAPASLEHANCQCSVIDEGYITPAEWIKQPIAAQGFNIWHDRKYVYTAFDK